MALGEEADLTLPRSAGRRARTLGEAGRSFSYRFQEDYGPAEASMPRRRTSSPRNDETTKVHCSVSFRPRHFVTAVLRNENAIKVKSSTSKSLKWGLRCPKR